MSDNTNAVAILQDLSSYWRERAKDYIENYMEEDDSDDIEDPIYAVAQGLRFTKRLLQALDYGVWKEEE